MRTVEILQVAACLLITLVSIARAFEQRLVRRLLRQKATDPERAIQLAEPRWLAKWPFFRLQKSGALRLVGLSSYYLDQPLYQALRRRRRLRGLTLLGVCLLVAIVAFLTAG